MRQTAIDNEQELLKQLREGSEAAFTELYHAYSERLYNNVLSLVKDEITTEELLQDIFVKIWQKRGELFIEQSLSAYLFTVSRNRVLDFFRKEKRDKEVFAKIKSIATEGYTHIEEALLSRENQDLLQKAIETLSPQRRMAFELCKMQGLSYKEASERMGISVSTINDHLTKAKDALREFVLTHQDTAIAITFFLLWHGK